MQQNSELITKGTHLQVIRRLASKLLSNWYWFVLCAGICFGGAWFLYRSETPMYMSQASILIGEEAANSPQDAIFQELNLKSKDNRIEDQIVVLKSRQLMMQVIDQLGLRLSVTAHGRVRSYEVYQNVPVNINFLEKDLLDESTSARFFINVKSATTFSYSTQEGTAGTIYRFGETIDTKLGEIVITPNVQNIQDYTSVEYEVRWNALRTLAEKLRARLAVSPMMSGSNIITITYVDEVNDRAADVVNNLISAYNSITVEEKRELGRVTSRFINDRIQKISEELSFVDESAEEFKTRNKLTDISSQATMYISEDAENATQINQVNTELSMISYLRDYVEEQDGFELLPSNIGSSDPGLVELTSKYNQLVLERNRLLKSSNEENPVVVNLDQQLSGIKGSLERSLENSQNTLQIRFNNLNARAGKINSKIYSVPGKEKQFRDISRQQQIKESLYLFLLQKREETTIALSNTAPNARVIDPALSGNAPISPNQKLYYLSGILLGLFLPFSIIYIRDILDTKIHDRNDLAQELPAIPIVGEIQKVKSNNTVTLDQQSREDVVEAFRLIRTNLDYLIRSGNKDRKIIAVTSSIAGEGKTFVAMNLAQTMATTGIKTLLIGADIRNPGLKRYFQSLKATSGLTEYLHDQTVDMGDIIKPSLTNPKLDVIHAGSLVPNPTELLNNGRLENLLQRAANMYDLIIMDTAPSMIVSDTLEISKFTDLTLYVVRAGYLDKKALSFVREQFQKKSLPGLALVLNDVKESQLGYGTNYGYGYGYGTSKKKKGFKRFSS